MAIFIMNVVVVGNVHYLEPQIAKISGNRSNMSRCLQNCGWRR